MPEEEEDMMSHEELTDVEPHELPEEMREDTEEAQPVEEEEEPVEEQQQVEEEPEVEETEVEDDVVTNSQGRPLTQAELDEKIQRRLRRYDRKKEKEWEKKLREQFGTSNLNEAAQFYQAGRAVSERAGAPPTSILQRLRGKHAQTQQQPQGQSQPQGGERTMQNTQPMNPGGSDPTLEEIRELKDMLEEERQQKARQQQEKQARQEFGDLFEDYKMDIEDYAEDYGLPLQDAAAAVLRPHLKDHYQKRERKKRKVQRRKKVESTEESPESQEEDPAATLTPREKEVARKMGMTQKDYYERAKAKGRFDRSG